MILCRPDRLHRIASRCGPDGIGIHGEAVADLGKAAVVVPFRDMAEVQFLEAVGGIA